MRISIGRVSYHGKVLFCALVCGTFVSKAFGSTHVRYKPFRSKAFGNKLSDARLSGPRCPGVPKAYAERPDPGPPGWREKSRSGPRMTPLRRAPKECPGPAQGVQIQVCAGLPRSAQGPRRACRSRPPGRRGGSLGPIRVGPLCAGLSRSAQGPRKACRSRPPGGREV